MGLWTSQAVSGVFALVIYYWAINVALSAETINRMIETVVLPEEEGVVEIMH
jgi:hypothetical protein